MDHHEFDATVQDIANVLAKRSSASRRSVVMAVPAIAAMLFVRRAKADGGDLSNPARGTVPCRSSADCLTTQICLNGSCAVAPTGGTSNLDAPPITSPTPTAGATATPGAGGTTPEVGDEPLSAGIYQGTCGSLAKDPKFALIDITNLGADGKEQKVPEGAPSDVSTDFSATVVNAKLADLVGKDFVIDIRTDAKDPKTTIACTKLTGEIDTTAAKPEIVIPIAPAEEGGLAGTIWLRDQDTRTLSYVFVERPTDDPKGIRKGDLVLPSADLNMRAEASTDAEIVEVVGVGVELLVTGAPKDGWVPVTNEASGNSGFVNEEWVEKAAA